MIPYTREVIVLLVYAVGVYIAVCIMTALQLGLYQMPDASSTNISVGLCFHLFLDVGLMTGYQIHS